MKRGDVYYLRYDKSYGYEMATGRPVVVLSSNDLIARLPIVQVAFLTTSPRHTGCEVEVNSLPRRSWVVCSQINTIDASRLDTPSGHLTDLEMDRVELALLQVLGLRSYVVDEKEKEVEAEEDVVRQEPITDAWLEKEVELYQNLYTKAMARLAEVQFDYDMLRLQKVVDAPKPKVAVVEPEPKLDLSELKKVANVHESKPVKKQTEVVEGKKVNINTATAEEIHKVTGLGTWVSSRIVQHRNAIGKYKSVDELLSMKEIGPRSFKMASPFMEV